MRETHVAAGTWGPASLMLASPLCPKLFSQEVKQMDLDMSHAFRSHIMFWDRFGIE